MAYLVGMRPAGSGSEQPRIIKNETPTARELAEDTPAPDREREGGDKQFYEKLNDEMQNYRNFRRQGMLSVNYDQPSSARPNHCIFWRRQNSGDKIRIFIYDPNDDEAIEPVNYMPVFSPWLTDEELAKVEFYHPFHDFRDFAFNMEYGEGVCEAVSYSLSRLWGVLERDEREKGGGDLFNRTREKFEELLSPPRVTAKTLIRLAMGKDYAAIAKVVHGEARPPSMIHAYENLKMYGQFGGEASMLDVNEDELPEFTDEFLGAGGGAGAVSVAGGGKKRLFTEMEDGTILVSDH